MKTDKKFVDAAISKAKESHDLGLMPVGAVLVRNGNILSTARSERKIGNMAHAEYRLVGKYMGSGLKGMTIYTTLEPCVMCGGMAIVGKADRVVYVLDDLWAGWHSCINKGCEYIKSRDTVIEKYNSSPAYEECREMLIEYMIATGDEWAIEAMLGSV